MREIRFSILHDTVRGIYIPQYSYDGVCWYSIEHPVYHYCRCFKNLKEAKKYIKELEEEYRHEILHNHNA